MELWKGVEAKKNVKWGGKFMWNDYVVYRIYTTMEAKKIEN
jgi:hypothetical protein